MDRRAPAGAPGVCRAKAVRLPAGAAQQGAAASGLQPWGRPGQRLLAGLVFGLKIQSKECCKNGSGFMIIATEWDRTS